MTARNALSALADKAGPAARPASSVIVGLIGSGIQASRTPSMHEREADALGLRYIYRLIDLDRLGLGIDALPELLASAERMGYTGLNVTFPCKQAIMPLLDELSDDARAIGAVNTVVLSGGRRVGHNTDCSGFAEGFRRGLGDVPRDRVVLLGAGGAGAAVGHAAFQLGVGRLGVFDAVPARAVALAGQLNARFGAGRAEALSDLAPAMAEADGLIHATPTGMAKFPGLPLPAALLHDGLWIAEIVYFPLETELLRTARARGCRTLDGGGMAVFQAVDAFRLFTGVEPDAERIQAHFASMIAG
ncbi:shikimate dehydrogenase [Azospirillum doebereinerae]|uniref:shikimate dehydrogenase n=1 Tax=Azospirillum doebereinerae TaxID=92933 RepID=UPI001EE55199|nr:shikimate dehydrogenase [Azospirillum doebereinerae]MCG5238477.1 shikimate dehydrogenase [Azospirillum doebereinerae]